MLYVYIHVNQQDGRLGQPSDYGSINTPYLIENLQNIIKVTAGGFHSLALHSNGSVYSFERGIGGLLGLGVEYMNSNVFFPIPNVTNIVNIISEYKKSYIFKANGEIYGFGENNVS
jgi:alpha-tubulin suppressor-like RCC1 family protein